MNKEEFLKELEQNLSGLQAEDTAERLSFYREMIDARVEEGVTEETAVAEIGEVRDVASQIMSEIPLSKLVRENVKTDRSSIKPWHIILLILTFPVWFSLSIVATVLMLALYVVFWLVVACLYIIDIALAIGAVVSLICVEPIFLSGNPAGAAYAAGSAVTCAGLSIVMFFFAMFVSRGTLWLTRKLIFGLKSLFIRRRF